MDKLTKAYVLAAAAIAGLGDRIGGGRLHKAAEGERGAGAVETILIVLGLIAISGLVITGITAFVNGKIGSLGN